MQAIKFGAQKNLPGFLFGDQAAKAGVIVVQEWWGITDEIKEQATLIANKGFRVLLPDLYKGKVGVDAEEASHLMGHLNFVQATDEIKQGAAYLKEIGVEKVGVIGFCMGGALSLCAAQHAPDVDAAIVFYGIPGEQVCQPEKIKKPLQLHFGSLDKHAGFSDPAAAHALKEKLVASGVEHELYMYEGVGHGFMNRTATDVTIKPGVTAHTGFPAAIPELRAGLESCLHIFRAASCLLDREHRLQAQHVCQSPYELSTKGW